MKTLSFDQFEFERPDSEEWLEIAVSKRCEFPHSDVRSFVGSAINVAAADALPQSIPFSEHFGYGLVRGYLKHFAQVPLPQPCTWPTYVLEATGDEFHAVICAPDSFIRYHWGTSA